jgi:riboflavin synthase
MGGHQVQGHVEASGKVLDVEELEEGWNMKFELPEKIKSYVVEKGYISVEGISLTVTQFSESSFSVTVIPETWKVTNLSEKSVGDFVNLESDPIGRYVEKMVDRN